MNNSRFYYIQMKQLVYKWKSLLKALVKSSVTYKLYREMKVINPIARKHHLSRWKLYTYHLYYRYLGYNIVTNQYIRCKELENISINGLLLNAISVTSFSTNDRGKFNVRGSLQFNGRNSLSAGCKFDIGPNAVALFDNVFVNDNTIFSIHHSLSIGNGTCIGWGCQFLDEDFHEIYLTPLEGTTKPRKRMGIKIGSKVLITNHVFIYKNVEIADGCVIASNSVVKHSFLEPNCLIAGNPAQVIKRNIHHWT